VAQVDASALPGLRASLHALAGRLDNQNRVVLEVDLRVAQGEDLTQSQPTQGCEGDQSRLCAPRRQVLHFGDAEEDGPMLDVLKGFQGQPIELPRRKTWQPDRDLLASRFETFSGAA